MRIALLLGFLAHGFGSPVSASEPAGALCDGAPTAPRSEIARRVLDFHRAIDRSDVLVLRQIHVECIVDRIQDVLPLIDSYCAARGDLGHDLAIHELIRLETELSSLALDCDRELDRRREEELGEFAPASCAEIPSSDLSMRKWLLDRDKIRQEDFDCAERHSADLAPPLLEKCQLGELSLRASAVEFTERMERACPLFRETK